MDVKKYLEDIDVELYKKLSEDYYNDLPEEKKEWFNNYEGPSYTLGVDNFIVTCPICGKFTLDNNLPCQECGWRFDEEDPDCDDDYFLGYKDSYENNQIRRS